MGTTLFHVAEVTRKGRKSKWGLDYYSPWELKPDGSRRRIKRFFETKDERKVEVDALYRRFAQFGASATVLPSADELADYRAMRAYLPPGVTAAKAARFFAANQQASGMKLTAVFAAYVESMRTRGLDQAWIKQVTKTLARFAAFMPVGASVADVTKEDGRRWMKSMEPRPKVGGYSAESRNNFRRRVYGAFEWAVKEELIETNPFERVEVPKIRRGAPPFYTVEEARAILATVALWYPDYVRFVALRFFVGMRRSQVRRLKPSDIDLKKQKIDAPGWREGTKKQAAERVTKSGKRHLIQDAPAVLWPWLEAFPALNTANHLQKFRRIFKRSAVAQRKNGFRHTFATYHVALHGNANLTMHILGQEEDSKAFFEHYRGHADKDEAERFFGLFIGAVLPTVQAPKKEDQRGSAVAASSSIASALPMK